MLILHKKIIVLMKVTVDHVIFCPGRNHVCYLCKHRKPLDIPRILDDAARK
jgi:hypothetical protein